MLLGKNTVVVLIIIVLALKYCMRNKQSFEILQLVVQALNPKL